MRYRSSKGFTLIELAVVIAIVAILAAVAIPRLLNLTDTAESAVAQDLISQLNSAAAMYTAKQQRTPTGFTEFAAAGALGANHTISLQTVGQGGCTVAATTINCSAAFNDISPVYTWNNGAITCVGCTLPATP